MVLSIFIDLQKAFDSVSHSLILEKLARVGEDGVKLGWFKSYLTRCKQMVQIGQVKSKMLDVTVGVPQGSLLSVLLFKLVINDMSKSLSHCTSILYADDTTLLLAGRSLRFLRMKMQRDLNFLSTWLKLNSMKLNVQKTKCMLFNKEGLLPNVNLTVDNELIRMVDQFKFLGVILDNSLTFKSHFKVLYNKLLKSTFVIKSLSILLLSHCLRILYFAYYHSHFSYCVPVWWPLLKRSSQDCLMILQKRIVRYVCKANPRQHCMPLFKSETILTIKDQVLLDNVKLMFHIENSLCPLPVRNLFKMQMGVCKTRWAAVQVVIHKSAILNKSFLCRSVMDW